MLNVIALVVLVAMVGLAHHRQRFGGGAGYATDPVCGMQVQTANAPAVRRYDKQSMYFCSDRCAERFDTNPERDLTVEHAPEPMDAATDSAADPICGMTVDPHTALSATTGEERRFFCSPAAVSSIWPSRRPHTISCAARRPPTRCAGMSVDPQRALCSDRPGRREFFCSGGCLQRYEDESFRDQASRTPVGHAAHGTAPSRIAQRQ